MQTNETDGQQTSSLPSYDEEQEETDESNEKDENESPEETKHPYENRDDNDRHNSVDEEKYEERESNLVVAMQIGEQEVTTVTDEEDHQKLQNLEEPRDSEIIHNERDEPDDGEKLYPTEKESNSEEQDISQWSIFK